MNLDDSFDPRFDNGTPSPPVSPFHQQEQNVDNDGGSDFYGFRDSSSRANSSVFAWNSSNDDNEMNGFGSLGDSFELVENFDEGGLNGGNSGADGVAGVSSVGYTEWAPSASAAESPSFGCGGDGVGSVEVQEYHQTIRNYRGTDGALVPSKDVNVHRFQNFGSASLEIVTTKQNDTVNENSKNAYFCTTSSSNENNINPNGSNDIGKSTSNICSYAVQNSTPKIGSVGRNIGASAETQGMHSNSTTRLEASPYSYGIPTSTTFTIGSSPYQHAAGENVYVNPTWGGSMAMGFSHQQFSGQSPVKKYDLNITTDINNDLNGIRDSIGNSSNLNDMNNGNGTSYINMSHRNNSANDPNPSPYADSIAFTSNAMIQGTQVNTITGTSTEAISETAMGSSYSSGISGINDFIRHMTMNNSAIFSIANNINSSNSNMNRTTNNDIENSNINTYTGNSINSFNTMTEPWSISCPGGPHSSTTPHGTQFKRSLSEIFETAASPSMVVGFTSSFQLPLDGTSDGTATGSNTKIGANNFDNRERGNLNMINGNTMRHGSMYPSDTSNHSLIDMSGSSPALCAVGSNVAQSTRFNERAMPETSTETKSFSSIAMGMGSLLTLRCSSDGTFNTCATRSNETDNEVKNYIGGNNVGITNDNINANSNHSCDAMPDRQTNFGSAVPNLKTNIESIQNKRKTMSESTSEAPSPSVIMRMKSSPHYRRSSDGTTNSYDTGINNATNTNNGVNNFVNPNTGSNKNTLNLNVQNDIVITNSRSFTTSIDPNSVPRGARTDMSESIYESAALSSTPLGLDSLCPLSRPPFAMSFIPNNRNSLQFDTPSNNIFTSNQSSLNKHHRSNPYSADDSRINRTNCNDSLATIYGNTVEVSNKISNVSSSRASPEQCSQPQPLILVGNPADLEAGNTASGDSRNVSRNRVRHEGKNEALPIVPLGPVNKGKVGNVHPMIRRNKPSFFDQGNGGISNSSLAFEGGYSADSTYDSAIILEQNQCPGNKGNNSVDSSGKSGSPGFNTILTTDDQRNDGLSANKPFGARGSEEDSGKSGGGDDYYFSMYCKGDEGRFSSFSIETHSIQGSDVSVVADNYDFHKIQNQGSAVEPSNLTVGQMMSVPTKTPNTGNDRSAATTTNDAIFSDTDGHQHSRASSLDSSNSSSYSNSRHDITRNDSPMNRLALGSSSFSSSAFTVNDNTFDTPVIVHRSANTTIYRHRDKGIKVVSGSLSSTDREMSTLSQERNMKRMQHEQTISQRLPPSCHKRHVLGMTVFQGQTALVFKWANGITLKEWIQKMRIHSHADLNVRLNAAFAIVATLRQFHDNGIVHNRLTADNIVLNSSGGNYDATFIDLQEALDINDVGSGADGGAGFNGSDPVDLIVVKKKKRMDLLSLGVVLNQLLQRDIEVTGKVTARRSLEDNLDDRNERKRGKQQTPGEDLPLYLSSLISTLLLSPSENENTECYENVQDVFNDLKVLIESKQGNLKRYSLDETESRLKLDSNKFYGRQVQMSMLMHLFQSVVVLGDQPIIAMIAGCPGTGKSTLVNQMKKPLEEKGGRFIEGKFDKFHQPDVVLTTALNNFFEILLDKSRDNPNKMMLLRWRIHDAIGSGGSSALLEIIPNLQKFMNGRIPLCPSTDGHNSGKRRGDIGIRMKYMLVKLIGAISHRSHPLVLFLDDLQWADTTTLDVIRLIMTDPDIKHFLFIGCYRDSEVGLTHPLTSNLNDIQDQGINVVTIKVGQIEKECVNSLVSDALCLPPSLCMRLSTIVHRKTGGIMLFILKFLESLNEEGLLWFSMSTRRWEYDLNRIKLKEISGDVVVHMTKQMTRLSKRMQSKLKCCACLGPCFDTEILRKAIRETDANIDSFLESSLEDGFFQHVADNRYKWTHDQIQQAAYELIPFSSRESFHLLLGSRMFTRSSSKELNRLIYFIVDNMNRGANLLASSDQKLELIRLNLRAGEKAISSSAFHSAAKYLFKGLSLFAIDCWETHYTLTLQLYDALSEVLFVTGEFIRLSDLIEDPLRHARCFEDKLNIYNNYVRSLIASGNYEECLDMCVSILLQLGETIPTDVTEDIFEHEVAEVKKSFEGKNREDLLSLPTMLDAQKLAAMQFLNHALSLSFVFKPILNPIVVFRMVKISIQYGVCNLSAFAFACYGGWLVSSPSSDFDGGHTMGRVANDLMKRLDATEIIPRLYSTVYGFINIWKEPFHACLGKHVEAADVGETTGDMEFSTTNLMLYVNMAIYGCGVNFQNLEKDIQVYMRRAIRCNQIMLIKNMAILYQLALDLMGIKQNAFSLYHPGMSEESCFADAYQNNHIAICRLICVKRKYVAFWMGDMDTAAKMYELHKKYGNASSGRLVSIVNTSFVDGMIALYFARKHRQDAEEWTTLGESTLQTWSRWAESSSWNFVNKLYLLEAEYAFLRRDDETAIAKYNASIKASRDHKFNHEEGLAEEKAATYLLHMSRYNESLSHLKNAKACYEKWGATALVERVDKAISVLSPLCWCP